jgi:hypothetical protein
MNEIFEKFAISVNASPDLFDLSKRISNFACKYATV